MGFIKRNLFGFFIAMIFIIFGVLFVAMIVSPKEDLKKRGFIPCTEKFVHHANMCENSKMCIVKGVWSHIGCGFSVVGTGVSKWAKGEQNTPWENYVFIPEVEIKNEGAYIQEGMEELYNENPNIVEDMMSTKELHEEMTRDE